MSVILVHVLSALVKIQTVNKGGEQTTTKEPKMPQHCPPQGE